MFLTCVMKSPLDGCYEHFAFDDLVICCHYRMICIKYETIQQPKRSLSLEFEHVLTNWSQTRGLEFSLDKTVLYHYFEVSFVCRDYMGSL